MASWLGTWRSKLATRGIALGLGALGAGVATTAALAGSGCSEDNPKASSQPPVVIGVSMGLTNDLATFSAPLRDAVRAAEGEINANGGVLGRTVQFNIVDDKSDEGDVVRAVIQGFANQKVAAIIGPIGSGQVMKIQDIVQTNQIITISPSATSVDISSAKVTDNADLRYVFRTTPADDFQGAAVIRFASKTPRGIDPDGGVVFNVGDAGGGDAGGGSGANITTCTKMGLVYINNSYGIAMGQYIKTNLQGVVSGAQVVEEVLPLEAASDYKKYIDDLYSKMPAPECLALIAYTTAGVQFVRDFTTDSRYADQAKRGFFFIGTDGIFTQGFIDTALNDPSDPTKGAVTNGVFGTNPDTQPGTTDYNAFRTIFSSYFPLAAGADAPAFASNAYDAAILAALAIEKAGKLDDKAAIRNALKDVSRPGGRPVGPSEVGVALATVRAGNDIDYRGASGSVDIQDNGNVTGGFIIWEVVQDPTSKAFVYRTVARFSQDELSAQVK